MLGPDREARLRALPAPQRRLALSEIASTGGFDGMELAANFAIDDADPKVVVAVLESLTFRRGDKQVNRIMEAAVDVVWEALGKESYPYHLTDPQLDARLASERATARSEETEPTRLLERIVEEKPVDAEVRITALLGNVAIDFRDMNMEHLIARAYLEFPSAIATGLMARIVADLPLPYRVGDYLRNAPMVDSGPVAAAALDPSTPERRLNSAAAVVGPVTISALFDQLLVVDDQVRALGHYDQQLSSAHSRLVGAITSSWQNVFVQVLGAKAQTDNPRHIGLMADLLARHGREGGDFEAANRSSAPDPVARHRRRVDSDSAPGAQSGPLRFFRSRACGRTTSRSKFG